MIDTTPPKLLIGCRRWLIDGDCQLLPMTGLIDDPAVRRMWELVLRPPEALERILHTTVVVDLLVDNRMLHTEEDMVHDDMNW